MQLIKASTNWDIARKKKLLWHIKKAENWLSNIDRINKKIFEIFWTEIFSLLEEKWLIDNNINTQKSEEKAEVKKTTDVQRNSLDKSELRKVYTKLVNEYHPDKNEWSTEFIEEFLKATELYKEWDLVSLLSMLNDDWYIEETDIKIIEEKFLKIMQDLLLKTFLWINTLSYIIISSALQIQLFEWRISEKEVKNVADIIWNKALKILSNYDSN